jgi:hypothetical protein
MTTATTEPVTTLIPNEWRRVPGYDNLDVTSSGQVWEWQNPRYVVLLNTYTCGNGYTAVTLQGQPVLVHTLVAAAFLGPRPPGQVVVHLDDDPTNNKPWALAYATRGDALKRAYARGSRKSSFARGQANRSHRLTPAKVKMIRDNPLIKPSRFARIFRVTCRCICDVRAEKTWRHLD